MYQATNDKVLWNAEKPHVSIKKLKLKIAYTQFKLLLKTTSFYVLVQKNTLKAGGFKWFFTKKFRTPNFLSKLYKLHWIQDGISTCYHSLCRIFGFPGKFSYFFLQNRHFCLNQWTIFINSIFLLLQFFVLGIEGGGGTNDVDGHCEFDKLFGY